MRYPHYFYIGIDSGGSKTHAILMDHNKKALSEVTAGAGNISTDFYTAYQSIRHAIQTILNKYPHIMLSNIHLAIGVAGVSNPKAPKLLITRISQILSKKFASFQLTSDCHIACLGAHNGQNGIIIICGTGVVGYYLDKNSNKQIGGWGFPHGDLGGGAWIGLEVCKLVCLAIDGVIKWSPLLDIIFKEFNYNQIEFKTWLINTTPKNFAKLAKTVTEYKTDQYAKLILNDGFEKIASFIQAIINTKPELPIKITGGLASVYITQLNKTFTNLTISETSPAIGACYLAMGNEVLIGL